MLSGHGFKSQTFADEYYMYKVIPLHSCDYLEKISIKLNVATDKGNSRNEIGHRTNDEIGVAIQSWF